MSDNTVATVPFSRGARSQELSTELRALLFAATREHTPEPARAEDAEPISPPQQRRLLAELALKPGLISSANVANYMRIWVTECAPWLDMFDQERTFGLQVPCLAQHSSPVLYAMLALSARQLERSTGMPSHNSIELYSEAIATLSAALDARNPNVPVTACILCVLEMMSASPRDWRRHLEGCAALFAAADVHGLSGGLLQAIFWCYARMDLCSAIISEGGASTVLPVAQWIGTGQSSELLSFDTVRSAISEQCGASPDMHANYMVYLTARVCDLHARCTRFRDSGEHDTNVEDVFSGEWGNLRNEVLQWHKVRPQDLLPVMVASTARLFPRAFYAHHAAISSNQLYHTACILLQTMHNCSPTTPQLGFAHSPLWHARCVVGISLANPHKGCLNNAIQPLYVAGRLFTHREEQSIVVDLLDSIERGSGWASRWRIRDLEIVWGYPPGAFLV